MLQERRRRPEEERPPGQVAAADDAHQLHLHERLDHVARVHAAHALDLRARDGLAVGDDRERLDRRAREHRRAPLAQHLPQPRPAGLGAHEAIAAVHLRQLEPDPGLREALAHLRDGAADLRGRADLRGGLVRGRLLARLARGAGRGDRRVGLRLRNRARRAPRRDVLLRLRGDELRVRHLRRVRRLRAARDLDVLDDLVDLRGRERMVGAKHERADDRAQLHVAVCLAIPHGRRLR